MHDQEPIATPVLSFVVETLNLRDAHDYSLLDAALASISNQTVERSRFEIIAVVDPQAEPTLAGHLGKRWPEVRVCTVEPGTHYYGMKNAGVRLARGRVIGFVDADCQVASTWVESILSAFDRESNPAALAVGAYDTPRSDVSWIAKAFLITMFAGQVGKLERPTSSFAASNSAARSNCLLAEPFREDPFFHGPDVEFATSALARGERLLLVPGASNIHDHEPGYAAQHGRGVYWGYCFLRLRLEGSPTIKYARPFRRLGPLAPLAVLPAKALIDVKHAIERRRDLNMSMIDTVGVCGLLMLNAFSVAQGAMWYYAGLPLPRPPQVTRFASADADAN